MPNKPEALIGGVDWISKKWLFETFMEAENLSWDDPWLQSLDLEYHNIDPARGLFFRAANRPSASANGTISSGKKTPPSLRRPIRARAAEPTLSPAFRKEKRPYVINWDSIACESHDFLVMGDPFQNYIDEVDEFIRRERPSV